MLIYCYSPYPLWLLFIHRYPVAIFLHHSSRVGIYLRPKGGLRFDFFLLLLPHLWHLFLFHRQPHLLIGVVVLFTSHLLIFLLEVCAVCLHLLNLLLSLCLLFCHLGFKLLIYFLFLDVQYFLEALLDRCVMWYHLHRLGVNRRFALKWCPLFLLFGRSQCL